MAPASSGIFGAAAIRSLTNWWWTVVNGVITTAGYLRRVPRRRLIELGEVALWLIGDERLDQQQVDLGLEASSGGLKRRLRSRMNRAGPVQGVVRARTAAVERHRGDSTSYQRAIPAVITRCKKSDHSDARRAAVA